MGRVEMMNVSYSFDFIDRFGGHGALNVVIRPLKEGDFRVAVLLEGQEIGVCTMPRMPLYERIEALAASKAKDYQVVPGQTGRL